MRVEKTADGVAMMRALEQHEPSPLFEDPLAARFVSGWAAVVLARRPLRAMFLRVMERLGPGFYGAVVCRTRAIDDECRAAIAGGIRRVVILGAGMDTRAHRMPEMAATRVVELDLPSVQRIKQAALPADHVTYVPIDLLSPEAAEVLAGTVGDIPTLLLCEAVTMYLTGDAVERIFAHAGALPPGSRVILTYLPRAVADRPDQDFWSRRLRWRSAFHPHEIADRLATHGWSPVRDVGADEHQERLLRPIGRTLRVFPGERIVIADKTSDGR